VTGLATLAPLYRVRIERDPTVAQIDIYEICTAFKGIFSNALEFRKPGQIYLLEHTASLEGLHPNSLESIALGQIDYHLPIAVIS